VKKPAKTTIGRIRPADETQQAVGGFEAAAIMGVHFTVPYRLAKRGKLVAHTHDAGETGRRVTFFDGAECEADYLDYSEKMDASGGTGKRPRENLKHRAAALRHLAKVKQKIQLSDAISTSEAAEILGMVRSFVPKMATAGTIVGRKLWSPRAAGGASQWMFSRKSCLDNLAKTKVLYSSGKMQGRVRYGIAKKK
jgi:hypothetical protein